MSEDPNSKTDSLPSHLSDAAMRPLAEVDAKRHASPATLDALMNLHRLAFGPMMFQAARLLWKRGILDALFEARGKGLSLAEITEKTDLTLYGVTVLCEAGFSAELLTKIDNRYIIARSGILLLKDRRSQVNFDFTHDVCYQGMFFLEESLDQERAVGLECLGDFSTLYEGLSKFTVPQRESWLSFDHFYSDNAYKEGLEKIAHLAPKHLIDVGGNTGRFSKLFKSRFPESIATIADIPPQLKMGRDAHAAAFPNEALPWVEYPCDVLIEGAELPSGQDLVWMSQFLTCFSEEEVKKIFRMAERCLNPGGRVAVLDTIWDIQEQAAAGYALTATSLYFTTMANGKGRIYDYQSLVDLAAAANLKLESEIANIGLSHHLLIFIRA